MGRAYNGTHRDIKSLGYKCDFFQVPWENLTFSAPSDVLHFTSQVRPYPAASELQDNIVLRWRFSHTVIPILGSEKQTQEKAEPTMWWAENCRVVVLGDKNDPDQEIKHDGIVQVHDTKRDVNRNST